MLVLSLFGGVYVQWLREMPSSSTRSRHSCALPTSTGPSQACSVLPDFNICGSLHGLIRPGSLEEPQLESVGLNRGHGQTRFPESEYVSKIKLERGVDLKEGAETLAVVFDVISASRTLVLDDRVDRRALRERDVHQAFLPRPRRAQVHEPVPRVSGGLAVATRRNQESRARVKGRTLDDLEDQSGRLLFLFLRDLCGRLGPRLLCCLT